MRRRNRNRDRHKKLAVCSLAVAAFLILIAYFIYANVGWFATVPGPLIRYPLLFAVVGILIGAVNIYLWKRGPRRIRLIDVTQFLQAFVIYEFLYYAALFGGIQLIPQLRGYGFMVFNPWFLGLTLLLNLGGYYVRLLIYEYLDAKKARKSKR
jgi:hypothetical protein